MFTPHSLSIALLMMITSAICWGSWANTYKGVKNYRFELFYWDYAVGIFLISLILGHTMGSTSHDAESLVNNLHSASTNDVIFAMVGGAIFNLDWNRAGGRRHYQLCAAPERECHTPGSGSALRGYRGGFGWQGLRQPPERQSLGIEEEHHHLHRLRSLDGALGALHDPCHATRS